MEFGTDAFKIGKSEHFPGTDSVHLYVVRYPGLPPVIVRGGRNSGGKGGSPTPPDPETVMAGGLTCRKIRTDSFLPASFYAVAETDCPLSATRVAVTVDEIAEHWQRYEDVAEEAVSSLRVQCERYQEELQEEREKTHLEVYTAYGENQNHERYQRDDFRTVAAFKLAGGQPRELGKLEELIYQAYARDKFRFGCTGNKTELPFPPGLKAACRRIMWYIWNGTAPAFQNERKYKPYFDLMNRTHAILCDPAREAELMVAEREVRRQNKERKENKDTLEQRYNFLWRVQTIGGALEVVKSNTKRILTLVESLSFETGQAVIELPENWREADPERLLQVVEKTVSDLSAKASVVVLEELARPARQTPIRPAEGINLQA